MARGPLGRVRDSGMCSEKYVQSYVDFLPLADVAHQPGQAQQTHQAQQLGQAQDAQRAARVQDLEALAEVLQLKCAVMQS